MLATIALYDAGFKDSAPALLSLQNQTILKDIQVIWVEYYSKIYDRVEEFDFIKRIKLNNPIDKPYDISCCYNAALSEAKGKYFTLIDPCLWFPSNFLENIYSYHDHEVNKKVFTFNREARTRKTDPSLRFKLTDSNSNLNLIGIDYKLINTNKGCASTAETAMFLNIDGFDIIPHDTHLTDRNSLFLCLLRMKAKYSLSIDRLQDIAYHAYHPTSSKFPTAKKIINEYKALYSVGDIILPEKGLKWFIDNNNNNNNMEILK